jgi:hypothetical protein
VSVLRKAFGLMCVLWAGSLWSLAWVSSIVFHAQSDRHLAGALVGTLLSIETYGGVALAGAALLLPNRSMFKWGYAAAALLAATEWGLKPVMARAQERGAAFGLGFGAWHGVSALLYLLACLALAVLLWKDRSVPA